jgi:predicted acetyltransferase
MNMILRAPTKEDANAILEYKRQWLANDPKEMMNGACRLENFDDLDEWFKKINRYAYESIEKLSLDHKVRQLTLLAVTEGRIIGMAGIRPYINNELFESGVGHIGYGVAPSQRRKGYGTEILRQGLEILKTYGVERAVIGCYKENIGSAKVIMSNGGLLDREWTDGDGRDNLRFYVLLSRNDEQVK